jgi:hypothetical protein
MRTATTHDLVVSVSVMVAFCLLNLVMQIVIITKSTIPADAVITDIRVFRNEVANDHINALKALDEIRALVDGDIARRAVEHHGVGKK